MISIISIIISIIRCIIIGIISIIIVIIIRIKCKKENTKMQKQMSKTEKYINLQK